MTTQRKKIDFTNREGIRLSALLELPSTAPVGYALFAHCFTCGKDIAAATRISRRLAAQGFGVLRFDFTGLGGSDGDFANTDFSSNVTDLVSAADFLRENYLPPTLLIGHSLGGAAVLAAANDIAESKAVVTIGSPASPSHVQKNFRCDIEKIKEEGKAEVILAGRTFTIKEEFIDDINRQTLDEKVAHLKRALLIFHAPMDDVVPIDEAAHLYQMAKHPKSFISLDQADHLLSHKADADYVADTIAAWVKRYLEMPPVSANKAREREGGEVFVGERNHQFLRDIFTDHHFFQADEPVRVGGSNAGPDPYELLLSSLGACTSMTIRMYANRKQWPVDNIEVTLRHQRVHKQDCEDCEGEKAMVELIERDIKLEGDLDDAQRQRLLEIADKCPVHKTLHGEIQVSSRLVI